MAFKKLLPTVLVLLSLTAGVQAEDLKSNWNDFLHYTAIGRFDLAQGFGQKIIDSQPDPNELLVLSEENLQGYNILLKMNAESDQLKEVSGKLLDILEQGRFIRRIDPKIITEEIRRLSTTIRGRIAAEERLKNAGEYAIPYMLSALGDEGRKAEFAPITQALPKIGKGAIRPLTAAMQTSKAAVKAEVIRALGKIGYFEPIPYLKYVMEKDSSEELKTLAQAAITDIDASALEISAAELFFKLGEMYYNRAESVAASSESDFANLWFCDTAKGIYRVEADKKYFNEMMAMRCCEWALKADAGLDKAIGLWIAAFFRAESAGVAMPAYFGLGHPDAMTYATTAGPEYLHLALDRALSNKEAAVALGVVEALAVNAGTKSLLYQVGTEQPLAKALSFNDRKVRTSAAIALGLACPSNGFTGSEKVIENLSEAITQQGADELGAEAAAAYALRAIQTMDKLVLTRNSIVDVSKALTALVAVTQKANPQMQTLAGQVLAGLESPDAQRAIAAMALKQDNPADVRIAAFGALADSAKRNANLLLSSDVDSIYALVQSLEADPALRAAAAGAFGSLNLPSEKVNDLIVRQSKS